MKQLLKILSLLLVLVISASLTIGLTFAPCFASLCTEQFFGYETRVHIATYYALLAPTGCFLLLRAYSPLCLRISNHHLTRREVPVLQKRISVGGLGLALWPVGITLVTTAFWAAPELQYWGLRWVNAKVSRAVTGLIGHHANYLLSLVIIPAFVGSWTAAKDLRAKDAFNVYNAYFTKAQSMDVAPGTQQA
ncbi:hypothetical protein LTR09_012547 [Extremus antarcticus]|uniref:Uncharacterized protein n=1 Tax=Extremus antarcticus TaxID=702011 RepID=A0AAJ0G6P7_9PEZI|nr:hypothetical protein LTR09_012547 [Extremus antarcticus]